MAEEIAILSVPPDAVEHAARFGAKYDSKNGSWYVVGPVPPELLNYVPRSKNQRFQETAPRCPVCGSPTRKLVNRAGNPFWACVTYFKTRCPGVVDYPDYLDAMEPWAKVGEFLPKVAGSLFGPPEPPPKNNERTPHPLRPRWQEIVQEAWVVFGDPRVAERWLFYPKVAFNNKTPAEMCRTEAGCVAVLKLLRDVWK
jgi:hypothetical protein